MDLKIVVSTNYGENKSSGSHLVLNDRCKKKKIIIFPHCSKKYILHRRHQLGPYESIPRVYPVRVDQRHASPVHRMNKAVDKGHWNRDPYPEKSYTQTSCSYKPSSHFSEFYLDFFSQVLYLIQIRTKGRPWHDSDVVLLEKVPGGSGSVGAGLVRWNMSCW